MYSFQLKRSLVRSYEKKRSSQALLVRTGHIGPVFFYRKDMKCTALNAALRCLTQRIDAIYQGVHDKEKRFFLHYGDLTDIANLISLVQKIQPDEIYNLGAAQSHVQVSFESPEYTANVDALGTLRVLEAVRILGLAQKNHVYQASTSKLYGMVRNPRRGKQRRFTHALRTPVLKIMAIRLR